MNIPTHQIFNTQTQIALMNRVESYLGEDCDEFNKYGDAIKKTIFKKFISSTSEETVTDFHHSLGR